jgi:hypothetical protein
MALVDLPTKTPLVISLRSKIVLLYAVGERTARDAFLYPLATALTAAASGRVGCDLDLA